LFAELAFAIEPEKPKSFAKTITIGGNAAFYTSQIELMAERKAYPYQASFFCRAVAGEKMEMTRLAGWLSGAQMIQDMGYTDTQKALLMM
jgi:hypothetical protein